MFERNRTGVIQRDAAWIGGARQSGSTRALTDTNAPIHSSSACRHPSRRGLQSFEGLRSNCGHDGRVCFSCVDSNTAIRFREIQRSPLSGRAAQNIWPVYPWCKLERIAIGYNGDETGAQTRCRLARRDSICARVPPLALSSARSTKGRFILDRARQCELLIRTRAHRLPAEVAARSFAPPRASHARESLDTIELFGESNEVHLRQCRTVRRLQELRDRLRSESVLLVQAASRGDIGDAFATIPGAGGGHGYRWRLSCSVSPLRRCPMPGRLPGKGALSGPGRTCPPPR